jgi:microcystin-dependent protein
MSEQQPVRFSPYAKLLITGAVGFVFVGCLLLWLFLRPGTPAGSVIMWTGTDAPRGWAICDGTNGTPDLRGKFILSVGSGRGLGDTGGEETHLLTVSELPSHTHSGTVDSSGDHSHTGTTNITGNHTHTVTNTVQKTGNNTPDGLDFSANEIDNINTTTTTTSANGDHSHTLTTNTTGSHLHTFTSNSTGGGEAHNNMPPYYVLAYIMKL